MKIKRAVKISETGPLLFKLWYKNHCWGVNNNWKRKTLALEEHLHKRSTCWSAIKFLEKKLPKFHVLVKFFRSDLAGRRECEKSGMHNGLGLFKSGVNLRVKSFRVLCKKLVDPWKVAKMKKNSNSAHFQKRFFISDHGFEFSEMGSHRC